MTFIWFVVWFIADLVGGREEITFAPANWWARLLLLAVALDLAGQHAGQRGRSRTRSLSG